MKRIIAFIMLAALLLGFLAPLARAEEVETTAATEPTEAGLGGWMSDNFYWELKDGTLTITGEGTMPGEAPWREHSQKIEKLFFDGSIYNVTGGAFRDCHSLKEVQFSNSLTEIGEYAFAGCASLEEIRLPSGFKRFGAMSFGGCTSLKTVYCSGYMPRFEESCLWNDGGAITIFYAPEKAWKADDIKTLERNFGGRLEVRCTDGTDPVPDEEGETQPQQVPVPAETEAPTEPATMATEPPVVTVPETEAPTVPETTVPETTLPEVTVPETTAPVPTEEPTEATEPVVIEKETVRGGFIGLALVLGVLTFFIVGALVYKNKSRGGRY